MSQPLVLIVDADVTTARQIRDHVEAAGCTALVAQTAADAREIARAGPPDLVILDRDVPVDSIDKLGRYLRVAPERLVLMSASIAPGWVGDTLVLPKPVDHERIGALVGSLPGARGAA